MTVTADCRRRLPTGSEAETRSHSLTSRPSARRLAAASYLRLRNHPAMQLH
ncbi:hypothetical protein JYU34_002887 [Plutella xylostella]|uniref:Uncharacterized protein n=1 Tax=Plutella xylostella TaxID=51655 RepID=A0ABQ7R3H9_PLUXY|nr:hypothetical protein JYU34_002887 [Plutella xylostella]